MRVIAGTLKGRPIPFDNRRFGNAEATPQKVKKALFSILGDDMGGRSFLDLYSCSGQMGIEAISRGSASVAFNESDHRRYRFIKDLLEAWGLASRAQVFNLPAFRCLRRLNREGAVFDFVFLDPPYHKEKGKSRLYTAILEEVGKSGVLKTGGLVIVQHFAHSVLDETAGPYTLLEGRQYGTNGISFYTHARDTAPARVRPPV
jgi:16S rRNA (guanine(966)-N(2))-methyltransferase RsmD